MASTGPFRRKPPNPGGNRGGARRANPVHFRPQRDFSGCNAFFQAATQFSEAAMRFFQAASAGVASRNPQKAAATAAGTAEKTENARAKAMSRTAAPGIFKHRPFRPFNAKIGLSRAIFGRIGEKNHLSRKKITQSFGSFKKCRTFALAIKAERSTTLQQGFGPFVYRLGREIFIL